MLFLLENWLVCIKYNITISTIKFTHVLLGDQNLVTVVDMPNLQDINATTSGKIILSPSLQRKILNEKIRIMMPFLSGWLCTLKGYTNIGENKFYLQFVSTNQEIIKCLIVSTEENRNTQIAITAQPNLVWS